MYTFAKQRHSKAVGCGSNERTLDRPGLRKLMPVNKLLFLRKYILPGASKLVVSNEVGSVLVLTCRREENASDLKLSRIKGCDNVVVTICDRHFQNK